MFSKSGSFVVGIDASRNRSGGAKAHLIGILAKCDPKKYGIQYIHVWAYRSLLDQLPDYPWLIKHNPRQLEGTLVSQLIWQATSLADELKNVGCDVLFTTDASTFCRFKPMIVLSQDMLSYEPGVMKYFGYSFARLRLLIILYLQNSAFRYANGVIFLTKYAGNVIQKSCGLLSSTAYIPHGVGDSFKQLGEFGSWPESTDQPIRCVYVSNAEMYKHQWVVVEAFSHLRSLGINVKLCLIGGGMGRHNDYWRRQSLFLTHIVTLLIKLLSCLTHRYLSYCRRRTCLFSHQAAKICQLL